MAARTSGKKSKAAKDNKKANKKSTRKSPAKKGTAKKATGKKTTKKAAKKALKKSSKKAAAKTGAKATKKKAARPVPAGTGMLVRTRIAGVAKRLLGPSTTSGGVSASGGISHTNPARSAMLRRLLG